MSSKKFKNIETNRSSRYLKESCYNYILLLMSEIETPIRILFKIQDKTRNFVSYQNLSHTITVYVQLFR